MSVVSAIRTSRQPAAAFMVIGLFWGCYAAFVPVLKDNIGASDALFGTLMLGSAFGLISAMWLAPVLEQRLGPRGMQVGCLVFAAAFLLPGLSMSPWTFVPALILVGVGSGLVDVYMNARVSELEARTGRTLMNANHGVFSVGYVIGALVTGAAREAGLAPVAVFAGMGVVTVFLTMTMWMEIEPRDGSPAARGDFPWRVVLFGGGVVLVAFMTEATVESWSAIHIERTLHGGAAEGALGPAMLGITMAIGRFSGQIITERFDEYRVLKVAGAICIFGILMAAVAPDPIVAYTGFGILGLGVSVIGPIGLAIVGKKARPAMRTEVISKSAVMGFSGFLIAPMLMGLVSEGFGLRVAFSVVAIWLLGLYPLVRALRRV